MNSRHFEALRTDGLGPTFEEVKKRVWMLRATVALSIVLAAWCAPRVPIVTAIVLLVLTFIFGAGWWFARGNERISAAISRGDLEAVEKVARERKMSRYLAIVTLAVHGGAQRVRALGERVFCVCGECELDANDRELAVVLRALELVESGRASDAVKELKKHPIQKDVLPPAPAVRVAVLSYAVMMSGCVLDWALVNRYTRSLPSLRGPIELAMAHSLAKQGDVSAAATHLQAAHATSPRTVALKGEVEALLKA